MRAFNPLDCSNKLQEVGVDKKVADVLANELYEFITTELATKKDLDQFATKYDIKQLETVSKSDFKQLEITTKSDLQLAINQLEMKLSKFMIKCTIITVGFIGSLNTLFHFFPK